MKYMNGRTKETRSHLNDTHFIENTVSKWNYFITFDEEMKKMGF